MLLGNSFLGVNFVLGNGGLGGSVEFEFEMQFSRAYLGMISEEVKMKNIVKINFGGSKILFS